MCGVDVILFSDMTPLIHASGNGHLSTVMHLVQYKVNMEAKNNIGMFLEFRFSLHVFCSHVFVEADVWC